MRPMPDSAEELIAQLERDYAPACKEPGESIENHMMLAGQVELVQNLRRRYDWTQENQTAKNLLNKD